MDSWSFNAKKKIDKNICWNRVFQIRLQIDLSVCSRFDFNLLVVKIARNCVTPHSSSWMNIRTLHTANFRWNIVLWCVREEFLIDQIYFYSWSRPAAYLFQKSAFSEKCNILLLILRFQTLILTLEVFFIVLPIKIAIFFHS